MEITLRPARKDETDELAALIVSPGDDLFAWLFGGKCEVLIHDAVVANNTPFSWNHVIVAEFRGEIVGLILHYPYEGDKEMHKNFIRILKKHIGFFGVIKVYFRERKWEKSVEKPRDSYYVEVISVKKGFRHKGIGTVLLHYIEALAKKQGFRNLTLEVESKNLPAVGAYEKFGFKKFSSVQISKFLKDGEGEVWVMNKKL